MSNARRCLSLTLLLVAAVSAFAQQKPSDPTVEVEPLREHLFRLGLSTPYGPVNVVASVGEDGVLLVDTGSRASVGSLTEALRKLGGKEVKFVVNTHSHAGHLEGNDAFAPKATIIAHARTRGELTTGRSLLLELPADSLPAVTFDDEMSIHFNGEVVKLKHLSYGHSASDAIVQFTDSRVICLGGLVYSDGFPSVGVDQGCTAGSLAAHIESILRSSPKDAVFVPGHGRSYDMEDLKAYHEMLVKSIGIVDDALNRGVLAADLKEAGVLNAFGSWSRAFLTTDAWIDMIAAGRSSEKADPKSSIIDPLYAILSEGGTAGAVIEEYRQLKATGQDEYAFVENDLNALGYYLMLRKNRVEDAIAIFELNVEEYPDAFNTYDSLAEALMVKGDIELAIRYYRKSLELNPENTNAAGKLKELGAHPTGNAAE